MRNGLIVVIFILLIASAITLRIDNFYVNILGIFLCLSAIAIIGISLANKKNSKKREN